MVVAYPRLSKSKINAGLQCERRLWLETFRRDAMEVSAEAQAAFDAGNEVGEIARRFFGPGVLIGHQDALDHAIAQTRELVAARPRLTLFEAAFRHADVLVRADVLKPVARGYDLIEVKSATDVKDTYINDCAIQAWTISNAGVPLRGIYVAHINNKFVYLGDGDYTGLLVTKDVTEAVRERMTQVPGWVKRFKNVLLGIEPKIKTGAHCGTPYPCACLAYCKAQEPAGPKFPVDILPHAGKLVVALQDEGYADLCKVPASRLKNPRHLRVRAASISGKPFLDPQAAKEIGKLAFPRYYLDFETVSFAVPRWAGTRPYQQLPFQWSCHVERANGTLEAKMFLDLSGQPPMRAFAESMLDALGRRGPILVYNAQFEAGRIKEAAEMYPDIAKPLEALLPRVVDLLPIAREHYYHPDMGGSWSIKKVIPTIAPELDYDDLEEVASSGDAPLAYCEAIHPDTTTARRAALDAALRRYCANDTIAMVKLARAFAKG
jgi:hypothetical protein